MKKIDSSGMYVNFTDHRSSSCPNEIAFSTARSDSLSSITRNMNFSTNNHSFSSNSDINYYEISWNNNYSN